MRSKQQPRPSYRWREENGELKLINPAALSRGSNVTCTAVVRENIENSFLSRAASVSNHFSVVHKVQRTNKLSILLFCLHLEWENRNSKFASMHRPRAQSDLTDKCPSALCFSLSGDASIPQTFPSTQTKVFLCKSKKKIEENPKDNDQRVVPHGAKQTRKSFDID